MKTKRAILLYFLKPILCLLFLLLVQSVATAQISYGPSVFQMQDEKTAKERIKETESIYKSTHLEVGASYKKRERTDRQQIIQSERRKLRFNRNGKAVIRNQHKQSKVSALVKSVFKPKE